MHVFFPPYQSLAFPKSQCLGVDFQKSPVFMDHSTHTLYYFGLYCQTSIKFLFMLKESSYELHKLWATIYSISFPELSIPPTTNSHLGADI